MAAMKYETLLVAVEPRKEMALRHSGKMFAGLPADLARHIAAVARILDPDDLGAGIARGRRLDPAWAQVYAAQGA